jgi:hypothetical protein
MGRVWYWANLFVFQMIWWFLHSLIPAFPSGEGEIAGRFQERNHGARKVIRPEIKARVPNLIVGKMETFRFAKRIRREGASNGARGGRAPHAFSKHALGGLRTINIPCLMALRQISGSRIRGVKSVFDSFVATEKLEILYPIICWISGGSGVFRGEIWKAVLMRARAARACAGLAA